MGRCGSGTRAARGLGLVVWGLLVALPARAEAGLSALPFWPAAPLVIAITLGAGGLAGRVAGDIPERAGAPPLPRVKLVQDLAPALLVAPPAPVASFVMPTHLPEAPGIAFEYGPRTLILRPDLHLTRDRHGALLGLRGTF